MNRELWERVQRLFHEAMELSAEEREEWLAGKDEDLEVRTLVADMIAAANDDRLRSDAARLDWDTRSLQGRSLGEFVLEEQIGRGSMGAVFRARQRALDRAVAVKVLVRTGAGEELALRFRREALLCSRLQHPGIVNVISFGEEKDLLFYAMELVDGWSLGDLLDVRRSGRSLPDGAPHLDNPEVCARVVRDIARALQAAHASGVLHRDIKPHNILLTRTGEPKLADFGLATALDLTALTQTGRVQGTPRYMSPEQALAERSAIDHRSDIYSLGVVLYELLAARLPHESDTAEQLLYRIANQPPVHLWRRAPQLPRGLVDVCMMAIRQRRQERYATAAELAEDLDRHLSGEGVRARPQSLVSTLRDRLYDRRTLLRAIPVGAAAGAAIGVGGLFWVRKSRERAAWPRLRVAVWSEGGELELTAARWSPEQDEFEGEHLLARSGNGGFDGSFPLQKGLWRFALRGGHGVRFFVRRLEERADVCALIRLRPATEVFARMTPVPGGGYVDRATVTNAEFDAYRQEIRQRRASSPEAIDGSTAAIESNQVGLDRAEWGELPVTGIAWQDACAYAEWSGKSLPTIADWRQLTQAHVGSWQEALDNRQLVIGWPMFAPEGTDVVSEHVLQCTTPRIAEGTTAQAYRAFVKPARIDIHDTLEVHHPVGNVSEWLATPAPPDAPPGSVWMTWGGPWHALSAIGDGPSLLRAGLDLARELGDRMSTSIEGGSADLGFRCAIPREKD